MSKHVLIMEVLACAEIERPVVGKHRVGDIWPCFAGVTAAQGPGSEPRVWFEDGLRELAEWLAGQTAVDEVSDASRELEARGLTMEGGTA